MSADHAVMNWNSNAKRHLAVPIDPPCREVVSDGRSVSTTAFVET
jgi:hypothetical protein